MSYLHMGPVFSGTMGLMSQVVRMVVADGVAAGEGAEVAAGVVVAAVVEETEQHHAMKSSRMVRL